MLPHRSVARGSASAIAAFVLLTAVVTAGGAWGQAPPPPARRLDARAIRVRAGYAIEPVVTNLSVPTTVRFDGPDLIITESGWANTARPRVLRITPRGETTVLAADGRRASQRRGPSEQPDRAGP